MKIWDISQRLHPATPVWPGDVALEEKATWEMGDDAPVNVASVRLSTHTGTHADAPLHYVADGASIANVSLEPYLGACLVVDGRGTSDAVTWDDIKGEVGERLGKTGTAASLRILIRTFDQFPVDAWRDRFRAIDESVIDGIADLGCILVGTDAPSLDPQNSKALLAHAAVARHGLAILEGLVLDHVDFGTYELIALPLPFENLDASPVRAVLRKIAGGEAI